MLPESFELADGESEVGTVIGEVIEILRGGLQFLHRGGRFRRHRLDDLEHLGRRFAEIGNALPGKHLATFGATRGIGSLGNVDRHLAEQAERKQPRLGVAINLRVLVHLHIDAGLEFRFAVRRRGCRVGIGRMHRRGGFLCTLVLFARNRRIQSFNLSNLATS